jgi:predicted AlkP superfamily phosphohydrolase/phosphomutase
MATKVLVIGLDGGTWDLILPAIEEGSLPCLSSLLAEGAWGILDSTIPPATFPAWSSFLTGMNPGSHGIFDFTRRRLGTYQVEFINSTYRRGQTLFGVASAAGKRVGVMGVPATYPPENLNGFQISGFDAPVAVGIDPSFVRPRELFYDLRSRFGRYKITDFQEINIGRTWHRNVLPRIQETLEQKAAIASYLYAREPWDVFMVLFGESDTVAHHYWMFHDPRSPRYDPEGARELGAAIRSVYEGLDRAIEDLLAINADRRSVLILSDHGFGGTGNKVVYLNRWLAEQGYLLFRTSPGQRSLRALKEAGLRAVPPRWQEQLFRRGRGVAANLLESKTRFGGLYWERTQAFSEELNYAPSLWVNLRGREPEGIVSPGSEYESLREDLIAALLNFSDPETGAPVVRRVYRREEIYSGPMVEFAPDLVLELGLDRGYSYSCLSSQSPRARGSLCRIGGSEAPGGKGSGTNGSHRREGIYLFAGEGVVKRGRLGRQRLEDLAPSVLALLGISPPAEMEGRVLDCLHPIG